MKADKNKTIVSFLFTLLVTLILHADVIAQIKGDTAFLRVSIHVFNNDNNNGNFHPDSSSHTRFLEDVLEWMNWRMMNLDTLKPEVSSPYVKAMGIQIRTDSFFYHTDSYAWDCSEGIDSDYMRQVYVDKDSSLNYRQKYRTLPIFLGNNYSIVGGHNSLIGDKWYIAMRGLFSEYLSRPYTDAVRDCGRGLLHELGHSLGLSHNFSGGDHGDQCDECEDNGCPLEGTSNNLMDYWPSYGHAISECQKGIIWEHLNGNRGNIAEILWNDSCYKVKDKTIYISEGTSLTITDTSYIHSDLVIEKGGSLVVNSYLSMPDSCSIIVEPGANLLVDNGTLGNLCGDIWEGVIVMKNDSASEGKIGFSNARIENARMGITIEGLHDLEIDKTEFVNNLSSLRIQGWSGKESISNCRFEINGRLNHWEEWQVPQSFVWLEDSKGITFDSCYFYNSEGHRNYQDIYSGIGIIASNSSLDLSSCNFDNLFKAIVAGSDTLGNYLSVVSCYFAYNHCNIQLYGIKHAKISFSSFNLNRLNTVPVYGIFARKGMFVEIDHNDFYSDYGGESLTAIVSDFNHAGTHLIHNNKFSLIDEGIVVLNCDNLPFWPQALLENSYLELITLQLGSVWFSNMFDNVKKNVVSLDSEGGGKLISREGEYDLFSVDWSKAFKGDGFASYAPGRNVYIIRPNPDYRARMPSGILFHILSDDSWNEYEKDDIEPGHSQTIHGKLSDEYFSGLQFLENRITGSHLDMVSIAAHIEKYPWVVYTSQFGRFLDREVYILPLWIWKEIEKAAEKGSWWKNQLHQFIISLANDQLREIEGNKTIVPDYYVPEYPIIAFSELSVNISTEIGRLNPGDLSSSSTTLFTVVPNPTSDYIGIRFINEFPRLYNGGGLEWKIRDIFGHPISKGIISGSDDLVIDLGDVFPGLYLIDIWNGNEFLGMQKFIILTD